MNFSRCGGCIAGVLLAVLSVSTSVPAVATTLVVVDAAVEGHRRLTADLPPANVLQLRAGEAPLAAIADAAAALGGVDSIHILSHGSDGVLSLAGAHVDAGYLAARADTLRRLGSTLNAGGSLAFYGCDLAAGEQGRDFVDTFGRLAGAPVFASTDATGHADLNGDWDLEYRTDNQPAPGLPFTATAREAFHAVLSHFRGGSITWQSMDLDGDGQKNDVQITVKTAWAYRGATPPRSLVMSPALPHTFSVEETLDVGTEYTLTTTLFEAHNLNPAQRYDVSFTSCCRISNLSNNANGTWNIQTEIFLQDGNLAPKIDLPILFQVPKRQADGTTSLQSWSFDIGSSDPNADKLRYRLANLSELGGGGSSNPAGLSINPNTGLLTWTDSGTRPNRLYSGGIVAEDVDEFGNPKSKTHVDFILDLQDKAAVGYILSDDVPETRNLMVEKGATATFTITGTAIQTTSLGTIQGALSEGADGVFTFDPGPQGSGLVPGSYPITFEIVDTTAARTKSYLVINFIVPDPNAPRVQNLEGDRVVYGGTSKARVDADLDAVVTDVNDGHLNGGFLKFNVTFTDGQFEVLDVDSVGDGPGEVRRSGAEIYYQGLLIGNVSATENGVGRALRIDFTTDDATLEAVQAVVRHLTYEDTFPLRAPGDRGLSLYLRDPAGLSNAYDFFVNVEAHPNQPPKGGGPIEASNRLTVVEGAAVSISDEDINYADPDDDPVTLTVRNVTHGQFEYVSSPGVAITTFTQLEVTLGQVAFAHDGGELAPAYEISASDGTSDNDSDWRAGQVTFTNVADHAPDIGGTPATTVVEGSAYGFTPTVSDADVGVGATHTFSVTNAPAWAAFDSATGTLSGTPGPAYVGSYSNIRIRVVDDAGASDVLPAFSITVTAAPDRDGDGVPDYVETGAIPPTDADDPSDFPDNDDDGVPDYVELHTDGTNPNDSEDYLDRDGDGVPDHVERLADPATDPEDASSFPDSDSDGVPDYVETHRDGTDAHDPADVADTDGDGVPDYVEVRQGTDPDEASEVLDSDRDGVPDYLENRADPATDPNDPAEFPDADRDGVPDYVEMNADPATDPADAAEFPDSDGDGVPDYVESRSTPPTDPNDAADFIDSDGDGVPDYVEQHAQPATDPTDAADFPDVDGDRVPDYVEQRDGTNPNDPSDLLDRDGDGVPDYVERQQGTDPSKADDARDTDGDGVPDYVEIHVDRTNWRDPASFADIDGDGIPNYHDRDNDNDGIPDADERPGDTDGDGIPDYLDASIDEDNDGIPDILEGTFDSDLDGLPDFQDPDSNNDGVPDRLAIAGLNLDRDGDGIADRFDVDFTGGVDRNGDGIDDDVVLEDLDGDGVADYRDADQDGDGLLDFVESGALDRDSDGDGIDDAWDVDVTGGVDANGDGIDDAARLIDTDADGTPDLRDLDSDGDGASDFAESGASGFDSDADGIDDAWDVDAMSTFSAFASAASSSGYGYTFGNAPGALDTDADRVPDFRDLDSDNDGVFDVVEAGFVDADNDGLLDSPTLPLSYLPDSDRDGVPDLRDLDSDGDGIWDISWTRFSVLDANGDGRIDDHGLDLDGDGIADAVDQEPGQRGSRADTDDDAVPSLVDIDDDGDGIPDAYEADADTDGDGTPDRLDRDSDNDGISDRVEAGLPAPIGIDSDFDGLDDAYDVDATGGIDRDGDGVDDRFTPRDSDGDGVPDHLDTDSDNDGLSDAYEVLRVALSGTDADGDGIDDALDVDFTGGRDENGDGIDDEAVTLRDTDGDGLPDHLDDDSDNDGVRDGDENGDFNGDGIDDRFQKDPGLETGRKGGGGSMGVMSLAALAWLAWARRRRHPTKRVFGLLACPLMLMALIAAEPSVAGGKSCSPGGRFVEGCGYVGIETGPTYLDPDDSDSAWKVVDRHRFGAKALVGYRFFDHGFFEVSYAHLGNARVENLNPAIGGSEKIRYRAAAAWLGYQFGEPAQRLRPYLKVGYAALHTKASDERVARDANHDDQLAIGGGIAWRILPRVDLRVGADSYDQDAVQVSIGLVVR